MENKLRISVSPLTHGPNSTRGFMLDGSLAL